MNRRLINLIAVIFFINAVACNNSKSRKAEATVNQDSVIAGGQSVDDKNSADLPREFDINSLPISNHALGDFPFFSFPEGLKATNKPIERKYDELYFPINGVMTPLQGRVWKTYVSSTDDNGNEWSLPYFFKSYDEAIMAVGGVKIFDGEINNDEYERYHKKAAYLGEDGSIGYVGQNIRVYVIRRANGQDIYIQLTGNTASGDLNILQKEEFKQTITQIKADQIQADLEQNGKSILHINFDTDKASLKPDGIESFNEIVKVLKQDRKLNLLIKGFTDNTGEANRNKILSAERAETVKRFLIEAGIDKARLSSEGEGQLSPIADNSTEEGRAKNRRVELIKVK